MICFVPTVHIWLAANNGLAHRHRHPSFKKNKQVSVSCASPHSLTLTWHPSSNNSVQTIVASVKSFQFRILANDIVLLSLLSFSRSHPSPLLGGASHPPCARLPVILHRAVSGTARASTTAADPKRAALMSTLVKWVPCVLVMTAPYTSSSMSRPASKKPEASDARAGGDTTPAGTLPMFNTHPASCSISQCRGGGVLTLFMCGTGPPSTDVIRIGSRRLRPVSMRNHEPWYANRLTNRLDEKSLSSRPIRDTGCTKQHITYTNNEVLNQHLAVNRCWWHENHHSALH